jgi:hypothetical protein
MEYQKMSKSIKKIAGIALPAAAAFVPGLGPLAAAGLGAAGGALSGGGFKGALLGGATAGLGNSLTSGALANTALGRGVSSIGNSLSDTLLGRGLSTVTSGAKDLFTGGFNPAAGAGATANAGATSGISSLVRPVSTILGGVSDYRTQGKIEDKLLEAQRQAQAQFQPYADIGLGAQQTLSDRLTAGFDPSQLGQDEGYQFRLNQGNQALQRQLSASGLGQSGAALKAAQEFGQGLGAQEYSDAYNRYLQQNQQFAGLGGQGLSAAGGIAGINQQTGQIGAEGVAGRQNAINRTLANLLTGRGALDDEENV